MTNNNLNDKYFLVELLRNICSEEPTLSVTSPSSLAPDLMTKYGDSPQEIFIVITLNSNHNVINVHEVTKGLVNRTLIHPREVFRPALIDNATAVVVAHNHPSGTTQPSIDDNQVTNMLTEAGKIIGIRVLDHLIIGRFNYTSSKELGLM